MIAVADDTLGSVAVHIRLVGDFLEVVIVRIGLPSRTMHGVVGPVLAKREKLRAVRQVERKDVMLAPKVPLPRQIPTESRGKASEETGHDPIVRLRHLTGKARQLRRRRWREGRCEVSRGARRGWVVALYLRLGQRYQRKDRIGVIYLSHLFAHHGDLTADCVTLGGRGGLLS